MGGGIFLKIDFCVENFNIKFNKKILIISIFVSKNRALKRTNRIRQRTIRLGKRCISTRSKKTKKLKSFDNLSLCFSCLFSLTSFCKEDWELIDDLICFSNMLQVEAEYFPHSGIRRALWSDLILPFLDRIHRTTISENHIVKTAYDLYQEKA